MKNKKIVLAGSEGLIGSVIKTLNNLNIHTLCLDEKLGHDLTNEKIVKEIFKNNSNYDVLISPFAINPQPDEDSKSIFDLSLESLEKYLKVNVVALLSVCREFARNCNQKCFNNKF